MARALEVFRANAVENRRLTEDQAASRLRADQEKRASLDRMAMAIERELGLAVSLVSHRTKSMAAVARTGPRSEAVRVDSGTLAEAVSGLSATITRVVRDSTAAG